MTARTAGKRPTRKKAIAAPDLFRPEPCSTGATHAPLDATQLAKDLKSLDWGFADEDTSFLTHDLHPYPAKFIPQIPAALISRLSHRGDLVCDPFGGSGTTALEAMRHGRRAVCVDANPIGLLVGRAKTARIDRSARTELHALRSHLLSAKSALPEVASLLMIHERSVPDIPNRQKWFTDSACAELALLRDRIGQVQNAAAADIARLSLSRIILRASQQDSETRYTARPREIARGDVIALFLRALDDTIADVTQTAASIRYGSAEFILADSRRLPGDRFPDESVDLVVTSPPYGNAMDYHLYHRFRLFWLGFDPRDLARIEIGSHLRHQREGNGFSIYREEMADCVGEMARVIKPGRFICVVIGDSVYEGSCHSGADMINELGLSAGLKPTCVIERPIHSTRRSFVAAGRRATSESICVLQKPVALRGVTLQPPPYRLWPYEDVLRLREARSLLGDSVRRRRDDLIADLSPSETANLTRLTFSHSIEVERGAVSATWQAILENGSAAATSARKDPKYVTHGLHPYKGKFYPQLAKSLVNLVGVPIGARILDPFCGSGTTLLEGYLNGFQTYGADLHPLAAKIARAKLGVLELDPDLFAEAVDALLDLLTDAPTSPCKREQFAAGALAEIESWFPSRVAGKLDWLLGAIRTVSSGVLRDYFEVVLSSLVREVSHQDPSDLRIRRRRDPLDDADVIGRFRTSLVEQSGRVVRFWRCRGYSRHEFLPSHIAHGDSRDWETMTQLSIAPDSVDLVLTSPPYATALPYIDTDRLSLLVLDGLHAAARRPLEEALIGSREIARSRRLALDEQIDRAADERLPASVVRLLRSVRRRMTSRDVGFRRQNMPALLLRFFEDMQAVLSNIHRSLRSGGSALIVMGDNLTSDGEEAIPIPTIRLVRDIAEHNGLAHVETIPITVTTENLAHVRNAIKDNGVIWLRKP